MGKRTKWESAQNGKAHKTANRGSSGKEAHKMGKRTKQQTIAVVGKKRTKWESAQNGKAHKTANHGSSGKAEKNLMDEHIHVGQCMYYMN